MDHPNSVSLSSRKNCFNSSLQLWWISLRKPSLQRGPPIRHHSLHWPLTVILVDKTKAHTCSELRFSKGKSRLHVPWLWWLLFSPEVLTWKLLQLFWALITRKMFFRFYVGSLVISSKQVAQIPSLTVPRNKRCNGPFCTEESVFQWVFATHLKASAFCLIETSRPGGYFTYPFFSSCVFCLHSLLYTLSSFTF